MEDYTFEPIDVVIHWYTRVRSWFIAKRDNRILYEQFSTDLHLDKLEKEDVSFVLPESYLISTNEIKKLYNVRDEILVKMHHKEYVSKQTRIDDKIKELEKEHELLKTYRANEKDDYNRLNARLKSTKYSGDRIALESRVSQANSKLKNTEAAIKNCESRVSLLVKTKKTNIGKWERQIELVEKAVDDAIVKYIDRSTKKIGFRYGFTTFKYQVADYDEESEKIVKGDY